MKTFPNLLPPQCDEPYQESQESIEIAAAQDDEEIIRLGSADKFVKIIETFDSSTPAERYSPPTPKEKKSRCSRERSL